MACIAVVILYCNQMIAMHAKLIYTQRNIYQDADCKNCKKKFKWQRYA